MLRPSWSRGIARTIRWSMLASGAFPWLALMVAPQLTIAIVSSQWGLSLVLFSYAALGLVWAAVEKSKRLQWQDRHRSFGVIRAGMLLVVLPAIPIFVEIGSDMATQIAEPMSSNVRREASGLVAFVSTWPLIWGLICIYALRPILDHGRDILMEKIGTKLDLRKPAGSRNHRNAEVRSDNSYPQTE